MALPKSTKASRRDAATFGTADIDAVVAFCASLKASGRALVRKVEATVSGRTARQFWTPSGNLAFNRSTLQFLRGSTPGRMTPVPPVLVKAVSDAAANEARFRMLDAALRLSQGKLEVAEWAVEHDRWLKVLHGAESALGRGGLAEMTAADWVAASDRVSYQYGFSRAFAEDVAAGRYGQPGAQDFLADGLLNRSGMYANAGRCTYENTLKDNARDRLGHNIAWRVLAAVKHCNSCEEVAAHGPYPIDEYPEIGTDDCYSSCQCITVTGFEGDVVD